MYDPIAYTYDADYHCPSCAEKAFGRDGLDNAEEVGVLAPWDEWQQFTGEDEVLACGTCGRVIDEYLVVEESNDD